MQCTRSLLKVVKALDQQVDRLIIAGDSMCTLMCVRREGAHFKPYFQNRVAEIRANLAELEGLVTEVEPTLKIAGHLNPADLCTRGRVEPHQISAQSEWQLGPGFLLEPREEWPLQEPDDPLAVPEGELRKQTAGHVGRGDV